jgi:hypothetical protein
MVRQRRLGRAIIRLGRTSGDGIANELNATDVISFFFSSFFFSSFFPFLFVYAMIPG